MTRAKRTEEPAAEVPTGVCVECLGPTYSERRDPDCEACGSGYALPLDATVADLLRARRIVECEGDPFAPEWITHHASAPDEGGCGDGSD